MESGDDQSRDESRASPTPRRRRELTPLQRALGLLTRREHSRKELARKLVGRGVEAGDAQAAIDKLAAAGWQDDLRFAETLIRSRARNGYGPLRIRAELGTHGLDRASIASVMEAFEVDWGSEARDLVHRRFGPMPPGERNLQRKAADMLVRRGFAAEHVRAATRWDPDSD
jgi:regulatory protein